MTIIKETVLFEDNEINYAKAVISMLRKIFDTVDDVNEIDGLSIKTHNMYRYGDNPNTSNKYKMLEVICTTSIT